MVEKTTILTLNFTTSVSESYEIERTSKPKDLKSEIAEEEKDKISAEQETAAERNIHIQLEGNSKTEELKINEDSKIVTQRSDSKDSILEKIEIAKEEIGVQSKSEEKKIDRTAIVNLYNRKIASQPKCNNTQTKPRAISGSFDDSLIQSEETSTVRPLMQSK